MTISNGELELRALRVGDNGTGVGTLTIAGGTATIGDYLTVGVFTGSTGTIWVTGGQLVVTNEVILVGQGGTGQMTVSNGTILARDIVLGSETNGLSGRGTLTIAGGDVILFTGTAGAVRLADFSSATGVVNVTSGRLIVTNASTLVGTLGSGEMMISSGTVMTAETEIGSGTNTQGALMMSGGMVVVSSNLTVAASPGSSGVVMMTGGELTITNTELVIGTNGGVGEVMLMQPGSALLRALRRPWYPRPLTVSGGGGSVLRARRVKIAAGSIGKLTVDDGSASVLEDALVGAVPTATGTVAVGTSLTVGGDLELRYNPKLECHICGYEAGKTFGHIAVGGAATFDGDLAVRFLNGFENQITNGASFTVLNAGVITGVFANVSSGQRLVSADGAGDFLVTYSTNKLVLSDFRNTFSRPSAGTFTILLPHNPADAGSSFPQGDGYAVLKINAAGQISGNGALADGSKLKLKGTVSMDGRWPVFVALYGGSGVLSGMVSFVRVGGVDTLTGDVSWSKPSGRKGKFYPNGFTTHLVPMGSRYTAPPVAQATQEVSLEDGNLSAPVDLVVSLDERFKATAPVKLTINSKTGKFTGSFAHPATGKTAKFSGVVLQQQNFGGGYFLGTNESGAVALTPSP
jgi:hypothetical protein